MRMNVKKIEWINWELNKQTRALITELYKWPLSDSLNREIWKIQPLHRETLWKNFEKPVEKLKHVFC